VGRAIVLRSELPTQLTDATQKRHQAPMAKRKKLFAILAGLVGLVIVVGVVAQ